MTDTLTYHKTRPLLTSLDLSGASLKFVIDNYDDCRKMLSFEDGAVEQKPESEALWFYAQNHAMHLVGQRLDNEEPLGEFEPFVEQYHVEMQRKTLRMFYYLLLIV